MATLLYCIWFQALYFQEVNWDFDSWLQPHLDPEFGGHSPGVAHKFGFGECVMYVRLTNVNGVDGLFSYKTEFNLDEDSGFLPGQCICLFALFIHINIFFVRGNNVEWFI